MAPTAWPVIRGTGGARKARVSRGGRGKSGGARVIYCVVSRRGVLYLLDIYAKSEKEDLTKLPAEVLIKPYKLRRNEEQAAA